MTTARRPAARAALALAAVLTPVVCAPGGALAQGAPRTLGAVVAHADDEGPVAPVLARYAREGARVHLLVVTDGAQGGRHTSIPRGPELASARAEEARCAAE